MDLMHVEDLELSGLKLVTPTVFEDERGYFFESFQKENFQTSFVQDNVSFSKKGTIRALHYQRKPGQIKLVSCLQGEIFDVAVDIRKESPTFGKWIGKKLSEKNHHQLYIPIGFAHGFCVLSETALVQYKVSSKYDSKEEKSIRWNDPTINISWPIQNPILSKRDQVSPFLHESLNS